jgi:hypothetical protein
MWPAGGANGQTKFQKDNNSAETEYLDPNTPARQSTADYNIHPQDNLISGKRVRDSRINTRIGDELFSAGGSSNELTRIALTTRLLSNYLQKSTAEKYS